MVDTELVQENFRAVVSNNPNDPLLVADNETLSSIVTALATALAKHDARAEQFSEQLFVDTASGQALDRLAAVVDVYRGTNQGDEAFRLLTRAGYARATSTTTIEDFVTLTKIVLSADVDDIAVQPADGNEPVVQVSVESGIVNNTPLTADQLTTELSKSVAAGHAVEIITADGTFRLDGDNYTPPSGSGLNDGTINGVI